MKWKRPAHRKRSKTKLFVGLLFLQTAVCFAESLPREAYASANQELVRKAQAWAIWDDFDEGENPVERKTVAFAVERGMFATIRPTESAEIRTLVRPEWTLPARLVIKAHDVDLCLLQTDAKASGDYVVRLDTRLKAASGSGVFTAPIDQNFTHGVLAGRDRAYASQLLPYTSYRLRMKPNLQMDGTPVFNEMGSVIAVQQGYSLENKQESHGIPAALVQKLMVDYHKGRLFRPVRIGARFKRSATIPEIVEVSEASPAEEAGLREGDVVIGVAGEEVAELADLVDILKCAPVRTPLEFDILRGLERLSVDLVPVAIGSD